MTGKISYDEMMDNMQDRSSKKEGSNSLSVEQLMQPRYMVIADYPDSLNRIGDVLEFVKDTKENWYNLRSGRTVFIMPANYPAIFRPMPWYEGRKVEEMPMYLKQTGIVDSLGKPVPDLYLKVKKHFNAGTGEWRDDSYKIFCVEPNSRTIGTNMNYSSFEPATEEEYISRINKIK